MTSRDDRLPITSLEDIAFLSRSANRVLILDGLTDGPFSRRTLADRTGVSRTTLDRIVNELEERGWAERTKDGEYVATPRGRHLMRGFRPLLETVEALHRLDDAVTWLPVDELSIGLEHFSDASVFRPESEDPVETIDYFNELLQDTSEFRLLTHLAPPEPLGATLHERISAGRMTMEGVLTDELFDYLGSAHDRSERWRSMIEAGIDLHRHEGPIPCNLWVFDDILLIKKSGPDPIDESYGVPIASENETVRTWANELIDEWMDTATPVKAGAFVADQSPVGAESSGR